jgi:hypothetical protein
VYKRETFIKTLLSLLMAISWPTANTLLIHTRARSAAFSTTTSETSSLGSGGRGLLSSEADLAQKKRMATRRSRALAMTDGKLYPARSKRNHTAVAPATAAADTFLRRHSTKSATAPPPRRAWRDRREVVAIGIAAGRVRVWGRGRSEERKWGR